MDPQKTLHACEEYKKYKIFVSLTHKEFSQFKTCKEF